jgi:hypothetical protein
MICFIIIYCVLVLFFGIVFIGCALECKCVYRNLISAIIGSFLWPGALLVLLTYVIFKLVLDFIKPMK